MWVPNNTIYFDEHNRPQFRDIMMIVGGGEEGNDDHSNDANEQLAATTSATSTSETSEKGLNESNSGQKTVWGHDATLALITAVESRYDDLFHIHKKKSFWAVVSEELSSCSFDVSTVFWLFNIPKFNFT